jgi:hypothetical protein
MSYQNKPPTLLGDPGFNEGYGLGTPLWSHTSSDELNQQNDDDEEIWEQMNQEQQEQQQQEQQQQEQQQRFMQARYANSPSKPKTLASVINNGDMRKLMLDKSSRGGKSRRVFRKKTKTTRRRNKKSNRSHRRRRRTSHVAKQT